MKTIKSVLPVAALALATLAVGGGAFAQGTHPTSGSGNGGGHFQGTHPTSGSGNGGGHFQGTHPTSGSGNGGGHI